LLYATPDNLSKFDVKENVYRAFKVNTSSSHICSPKIIVSPAEWKLKFLFSLWVIRLLIVMKGKSEKSVMQQRDLYNVSPKLSFTTLA